MRKKHLEPVWTTKNHHSIFVTQFPSLITHHSSLIFYHSSLITQIFTSVCLHHPIPITQYFLHYSWTPQLSLCQPLLFCYPRAIFPITISLFSFPLPLQPCLSPKAETQTQKNVSTSLAKSVPSSPVNNAEVSDVYSGAISPS